MLELQSRKITGIKIFRCDFLLCLQCTAEIEQWIQKENLNLESLQPSGNNLWKWEEQSLKNFPVVAVLWLVEYSTYIILPYRVFLTFLDDSQKLQQLPIGVSSESPKEAIKLAAKIFELSEENCNDFIKRDYGVQKGHRNLVNFRKVKITSKGGIMERYVLI
jgi:hypothetical protein